MEKVDARNQLETYLYNTRNTIREEKIKEALGSTADEVEAWVKEGIEWLESHQSEEKDVYDEKYKSYEEKIKPVMKKLYEKSGVNGGSGVQMGEGVQMGPNGPDGTPKGPSVEEVD